MKVLVTGAGGRVGRAVRAKLDSLPGIRPSYLVSPRNPPRGGAEIRVDLGSPGMLAGVVASVKPDAIIHLAAIGGAACNDDPQLAEKVNVLGTQVLADAAAEAGTSRVVFASTAAVYGDQRHRAVTEKDSVDLRGRYAEMKFRGEQILRSYSDSAGRSSVALRIFNVYGEGFSDSLVFRLLNSAESNPLRLHGLDTFVRDYVHADDVAEALLLAVDLPLAGGHETFNIGTGTPTSNRRLVERLSINRTLHYEVAEALDSYSCADISLARKVLGFSPKHSL